MPKQQATSNKHQKITKTQKMTVSYRAADAPATTPAAPQPVKVTRLGCCCKLSDLLPIVKQLHEKTRTLQPSGRPEAA